MVISLNRGSRQRGMVMTEMVIAMVIVVIALFPLGFSALSDGKLFKVSYQKAVAMEIVDGEMEILAAGDWRNFPEGTNVYTVHANAATNLPPGNFLLTRNGQHLRLEWKSEKKHGIGPVFREVTVK